MYKYILLLLLLTICIKKTKLHSNTVNLQKKSVSLWYLCHIRVIANCFQLMRTLHYFVVCVFINTEELRVYRNGTLEYN